MLGQGFGVGEAVGLGAGLDDRAVEGEAVDDGRAERGSVKVFVQPSGAGICSLTRVAAATWPFLVPAVLVGSRGGSLIFKVLP